MGRELLRELRLRLLGHRLLRQICGSAGRIQVRFEVLKKQIKFLPPNIVQVRHPQPLRVRLLLRAGELPLLGQLRPSGLEQHQLHNRHRMPAMDLIRVSYTA